MASVTLKNVYKFYEGNDKPSVSDFNLEIKDKEFVVFVGPSGCGKSTTLRMIAGLEDISVGEIFIDDVLVNDVEPKDRDIAMVFQNYALYPHMNVFKNMSFGLTISKKLDYKENKNGEMVEYYRHYTKEEIREKVEEAANILEISKYLDKKPKELSGGERQRVAIGRAIVRNPKVFLMDEPLSNLDAKLRQQMRSELILLRKKINTTFIYVTHDQVEAMTLGDRIVIMKAGVIQQIGTPTEVFSHPRNLFVADFIGTPHMNFMDGVIKDDKVLVHDKLVDLPEKYIKAIKEKGTKNVVVGIRPEHIVLDTKNPQFVGTIKVSEMMGSEYHLHVYLNNNDVVIKTPIMGLSKEELQAIENGSDIGFSFNSDYIHLFDKESELNLLD